MTDLVVDTSAAFAILSGEPKRQPLLEALATADERLMSMATLVELGMVAEGRRAADAGVADRFVRDAGIDVVAVQQTHADRAIEGWRRYGKGRHKAALNLGDCFTYALAIEEDLPILCVGDDFTHTDARVVELG